MVKECLSPAICTRIGACVWEAFRTTIDQKSGDLYISDAYLGLQVVGPSGGLATQLLTEVEGEPLHFTNDMDIDEEEDVIYFTDTSRNFRRR